MTKIKLDVYDMFGAMSGTVFIISAPTNLIITAQTGGMMCNHSECEGYAVNLGDFMQDFDDCSFGCAYLNDDSALRASLGRELDKAFEQTGDWGKWASFIVDWDRIDEIQEGWWPVKAESWVGEYHTVTGYLHTGNCD